MPAISPSCSDRPGAGSGLTAFQTGEKILHRAADFAAALDGEIGPGQPGIVAQYDRGRLAAGRAARPEPGAGRGRGLRSRPAAATPSAASAPRSSDAGQSKVKDAIRSGYLGGETLPIGAGAAGEMGAVNSEMVEQRRQAGLDRGFF